MLAVVVFPPPKSISTVVTTHVLPVSESIKNVCLAARPEVKRRNLGFFGLAILGSPWTSIGSQVFLSVDSFHELVDIASESIQAESPFGCKLRLDDLISSVARCSRRLMDV
jgi:hypothetical protein